MHKAEKRYENGSRTESPQGLCQCNIPCWCRKQGRFPKQQCGPDIDAGLNEDSEAYNEKPKHEIVSMNQPRRPAGQKKNPDIGGKEHAHGTTGDRVHRHTANKNDGQNFTNPVVEPHSGPPKQLF